MNNATQRRPASGLTVVTTTAILSLLTLFGQAARVQTTPTASSMPREPLFASPVAPTYPKTHEVTAVSKSALLKGLRA